MAELTRRPKNGAKLKLEQKMLMFEEHFENEPITLSAVEARSVINDVVELYITYQELSTIYGENLQLWSEVDKYAKLQTECRAIGERYDEFMDIAKRKVYELENLYQFPKTSASSTLVRESIRKSLFTNHYPTPEEHSQPYSVIKKTVSCLGEQPEVLVLSDTNPFKVDVEREDQIMALERELTQLKTQEESRRQSRYTSEDVFNMFTHVGRQEPRHYTPSTSSYNSSQELLLNNQDEVEENEKMELHNPPTQVDTIPDYASYKAQKITLNPTSTPFEPGNRAHLTRGWEPSSINNSITARGDALSRCSSYTEYMEITRRDPIDNPPMIKQNIQTQTSLSDERSYKSTVNAKQSSVTNLDDLNAPSYQSTPKVSTTQVSAAIQQRERVPDVSNVTALQGSQTYVMELDSVNPGINVVASGNTQQIPRRNMSIENSPSLGRQNEHIPGRYSPIQESRFHEMATSPILETLPIIQSNNAGIQTSFSSYQSFRDATSRSKTRLVTPPGVRSFTQPRSFQQVSQSKIPQTVYSQEQIQGGHVNTSQVTNTRSNVPPSASFPVHMSTMAPTPVNVLPLAQPSVQTTPLVPPPVQPTIISCGHSCNVDRGGRMDRYLHKIKVPEFNGDPRLFPGWWSVILRAVDSDNTPIDVKLMRLREVLTGDAKKLIDNLEHSPDAYFTVMARLEKRFGGNDRQLNLKIEDLSKLKAVRDDHPIDMQLFSDLIENLIVSFRTAGITTELQNGFLYRKLQEKLSAVTLTRYHRWIDDGQGRSESVMALREFVDKEATHMLRADEVKNALRPSNTYGSRPKKTYVTTKVVNKSNVKHPPPIPTRKFKCRMCSGPHGLWACEDFKKLKVEDRWTKARSIKTCFRCLGMNHRYEECPNKKYNCGQEGCKLGHHRLLHKTKEELAKKSSNLAYSNQEEICEESSFHAYVGNSKEMTSLRTVPVWVKNKQGRKIKIMALLDDGSTQSYVSNAVAEELHLRKKYNNIEVSTLTGQIQQIKSSLVEVIVTSCDGTTERTITVQTLPNIAGDFEPVDWYSERKNWSHLANIPFEQTTKRMKVDLLIGVDQSDLHIPEQVEVSGKKGEPTARKTTLGWTCVGSTHIGSPRTYHVIKCDNVTNLIRLVDQFWDMEAMFPDHKESNWTLEEEQAMKLIKESLKLVNGKYQVGLPWKYATANDDLPDNTEMALNRLRSTERKLKKNAEVAQRYQAVITEYEEKKYISRVKESTETLLKYYMPHFAITRMDRLSTKVRVVFDASVQINGISLNDLIHAGPKLQQDLMDILTRFRRYSIALVSDVAQMYMQIIIPEEDRDAVKFMWRNLDETQKLIVYRFHGWAFGLRSAPCIAHVVKNETADRGAAEFPRAAESLKDSTYMDDTLDSVATDIQAEKLYHDTLTLWARAGMRACKWASNSLVMMEKIPVTERIRSIELKADQSINMKTLGVSWLAREDVFTFFIKKSEDEINTKRQLLQKVATIYDPLGFVSPVIVTGRVLLQDVWTTGRDWDELLPDDTVQSIRDWLLNLNTLNTIQIPRVLQRQENPDRQEIHTFVDASSKAYGAVCYLISTSGVDRQVAFLASKVKVAPLKIVSIPRLELLAAVLGTKLATKLGNTLSIPRKLKYFWSDSQNILFWIKKPTRVLKQFIANRVMLIQEDSDKVNWRYIQSKDNPADVLSRGTNTSVLKDHSSWWSGPKFLTGELCDWPVTEKFDLIDAELVKKELKSDTSLKTTCLTQTTVLSDFPLPTLLHLENLDLKKYSSLSHAVRVMAWTLRFVHRCRKRVEIRTTPHLSADELEEAKNTYIRQVQAFSFPFELKQLKEKKPVPVNSKVAMLHPWLNEEEIMRADGRTRLSKFTSWTAKFPVLLPKESRFTELLIMDTHIRVAHGGVNRVLIELSQEYWILAAREIIRRVIRECVPCKKQKNVPMMQIMAPLPEVRTNRTLQVFENTSVDMAGPFMTKQGRGRVRAKRYLALFTCMSVSAVHLELTEGLDVDSFMNAFTRMVARRGCPRKMYSDRGSNFIAAEKELKNLENQLNADKIGAALESKGVKWHFNTPYAPHHGGVHEALVKSAKVAMRSIIGGADLNDFELQTVIISVEGLLNGRPLSYQTSDIRDETPLTPNHFVIGRVGAQLRPEEADPGAANLRNRWRRTQEIVSHFWSRWLRECVPILNARPKWRQEKQNIKTGDIVLLIELDSPRGSWPLGRIHRVFPGKDGHVRSVDVTVKGKLYRRPITKLIPLLQEEETAKT